MECRILRDSALAGRGASYELCLPGQYHGHFVCRHSGTATEFSGVDLERFINATAAESNFLPLEVQLKVTGVCERCVKENPPSRRKDICVPFLEYAQERESARGEEPLPEGP